MIKRPSRKLINSSLRSGNIPLCVNTYDYAYADPTDPSVPLPSSVGVTLNAPIKVTFPPLGVSGFTLSGNSFGVNTSAPALPFQVSNPTRVQVQASNPGSGSVITVNKVSDSASALFEIPTFPGDDVAGRLAADKLYDSGFYNRSDYKYLFSTYAIAPFTYGSSTYNLRTLVLVYSPLKFLPQSFGVVGYGFYTSNPQATGVLSSSQGKSWQISSITSPTLVSFENGSVQLPLFRGPNGSNIDEGQGFIMGTTTFAFNL